MPNRSHKYSLRNRDGYLMSSDDIKEEIGLGRYKRLPQNSENISFGFVQNRAVYLEAQKPLKQSAQGPIRRMAHRLKIECWYCGKFIPVGRIHQHEPCCKQR